MTQHRPGREARQDSHPALERMEAAIAQGKPSAFTRALEELLEDRRGARGLWQHRALGLVLRSTRSEGAETFLKQLMACPRAPRPSAKENFVGLALARGQDWALPLLAEHGFRIRDEAIERASPMDALGRLIAKGYWPIPEKIAPDFLANPRGLACLGANLCSEAMAPYHYAQGRGFLRPDQVANFIQFANTTLLSPEAQQGLARAMAQFLASIAATGQWRRMDTEGDWKHGLVQLIEAGLPDLPTLQNHLQRAGESGGLMQAFIEEQLMEHSTPQARAVAPRGARL